MLKHRKTGKIRRCGKTATTAVGTRRIPRTKSEYLRRGGQPKHFCDEHAPHFLKKEVSIVDGKPRRREGGY